MQNLKIITPTLFADRVFRLLCNYVHKGLQECVRLRRYTAAAQYISNITIADRMTSLSPGADWAAWLPGTWQVGRLVRRAGGSPRQMLK